MLFAIPHHFITYFSGSDNDPLFALPGNNLLHIQISYIFDP